MLNIRTKSCATARLALELRENSEAVREQAIIGQCSRCVRYGTRKILPVYGSFTGEPLGNP